MMESASVRSHPKVAVIVVNWNGREDLLECLESLKKIVYPAYCVIVVDNGSSDGSADAVTEKYPDVRLLRSPTNLRFAGGNNLGLKEVFQSDDDYCLLLNNDTIVEPDFLDHLVATAEADEQVGLLCPKILYNDRRDVIWFAGGVLKPAWGYVRHYGLRQKDGERYNQRREVSYLTGCCLLIKRRALNLVGYLDEGYYLYSEDADYCIRALKSGFKLVYEPRARIYHKVSQSTAGAFKFNKWKHRYASLFRLVYKYTSPSTWPLFALNLIWEAVSLPINLFLQTWKLPKQGS